MNFLGKLNVRANWILTVLFLLTSANIIVHSQEKIEGDMNPGKKLNLDYKCDGEMSPTRSKSAVLPNGDLLLGICDKIFRVNSANRVLWRQDVGYFGEFVYIPATNRVYVTNDGSTLYTFNAANGKRLDVFAQNGSAVFKNLQPFGRNGFLYVSSAESYRPRISDMADELNYQGVNGGNWTIKIPSNCEIVVQGSRIYAVTTTAEGVFTKELKIPRKK